MYSAAGGQRLIKAFCVGPQWAFQTGVCGQLFGDFGGNGAGEGRIIEHKRDIGGQGPAGGEIEDAVEQEGRDGLAGDALGGGLLRGAGDDGFDLGRGDFDLAGDGVGVAVRPCSGDF